MNKRFKEKLRIEKSENISGKLKRQGAISALKEHSYVVMPYDLDGDAPKQFIKAYFYNRGGIVFKNRPRSWNSYIAKTAEKWYPHESVIEFIINRIGEVMGLRMNKVNLVYANTQIRFLSEYFLDPTKEVMIHGAEICGEYLQDEEFAKQIANDKNTARELFNFEFISEAIKSVFPNNYQEILRSLVRLIVFDAVSGNNDRHFFNWAVIRSIHKDNTKPYFSPIYDSARGLMWNWSDNDLVRHFNQRKKGGKKIENYIELASPRISIETNSNINHFGLVAYIWKHFSQYQETIAELITLDKQKEVINTYNKEFARFFINERNQMVNLVINTRFSKLRELTT